jgi:hypothetical protein
VPAFFHETGVITDIAEALNQKKPSDNHAGRHISFWPVVEWPRGGIAGFALGLQVEFRVAITRRMDILKPYILERSEEKPSRLG